MSFTAESPGPLPPPFDASKFQRGPVRPRSQGAAFRAKAGVPIPASPGGVVREASPFPSPGGIQGIDELRKVKEAYSLREAAFQRLEKSFTELKNSQLRQDRELDAINARTQAHSDELQGPIRRLEQMESRITDWNRRIEQVETSMKSMRDNVDELLHSRTQSNAVEKVEKKVDIIKEEGNCANRELADRLQALEETLHQELLAQAVNSVLPGPQLLTDTSPHSPASAALDREQYDGMRDRLVKLEQSNFDLQNTVKTQFNEFKALSDHISKRIETYNLGYDQKYGKLNEKVEEVAASLGRSSSDAGPQRDNQSISMGVLDDSTKARVQKCERQVQDMRDEMQLKVDEMKASLAAAAAASRQTALAPGTSNSIPPKLIDMVNALVQAVQGLPERLDDIDSHLEKLSLAMYGKSEETDT
jgi:uncharacterized phage infection (PIP) family protein YhgE